MDIDRLNQEISRKDAEFDRETKSLRGEVDALSKKLEKANRPKGGLDEMIEDLKPFFNGRRLTYVDVGAYVGDVFAQLKRSKLKIREAHLFEPDPCSFELLVKNTSPLLKTGGLHHYSLAMGKQGRNSERNSSMTKITKLAR